jgi:hypothetical protein
MDVYKNNTYKNDIFRYETKWYAGNAQHKSEYLSGIKKPLFA